MLDAEQIPALSVSCVASLTGGAGMVVAIDW
jgi:hypothetical protein